ncbi:hypothetical protein PROFUN_08679 [Planoprotostelium fungivorum]|uniref:Uncharacterized protein n=1 Tax=Planoprotostelium fungivorum TaxID=1890364 RepID=A0A2P6MQS3_9EUKA|nr:hypothetical protein PROFUN_08679 [Planoprotostelium fungivorum]
METKSKLGTQVTEDVRDMSAIQVSPKRPLHGMLGAHIHSPMNKKHQTEENTPPNPFRSTITQLRFVDRKQNQSVIPTKKIVRSTMQKSSVEDGLDSLSDECWEELDRQSRAVKQALPSSRPIHMHSGPPNLLNHLGSRSNNTNPQPIDARDRFSDFVPPIAVVDPHSQANPSSSASTDTHSSNDITNELDSQDDEMWDEIFDTMERERGNLPSTQCPSQTWSTQSNRTPPPSQPFFSHIDNTTKTISPTSHEMDRGEQDKTDGLLLVSQGELIELRRQLAQRNLVIQQQENDILALQHEVHEVQRVASAYFNGDRDEMMQMTRTNGQMQSQKSRRVAALQAQMSNRVFMFSCNCASPTTTDMSRNYLVRKMAIYMCYHRNPTNRILHLFTGPILTYSIILLFSLIPVRSDNPYLHLYFNIGWIYSILISALIYAPVDILTASIVFIGKTGFCMAGNALTQLLGNYNCFLVATAGVVFVLIVQYVIGHGLLEKRAPPRSFAFYHVVLLPQAVLLNALLSLGYRPELASEILQKANEYIASTQRSRPVSVVISPNTARKNSISE